MERLHLYNIFLCVRRDFYHCYFENMEWKFRVLFFLVIFVIFGVLIMLSSTEIKKGKSAINLKNIGVIHGFCYLDYD